MEGAVIIPKWKKSSSDKIQKYLCNPWTDFDKFLTGSLEFDLVSDSEAKKIKFKNDFTFVLVLWNNNKQHQAQSDTVIFCGSTVVKPSGKD